MDALMIIRNSMMIMRLNIKVLPCEQHERYVLHLVISVAIGAPAAE
jgi:hypothetical protein